MNKKDFQCTWSNPPAVNATIEVSPPLKKNENFSELKPIRLYLKMLYPGSEDDYPTILYSTTGEQFESINYNEEKDYHLKIEPTDYSYGLCSLEDVNRGAKIKYLSRNDGGYLKLNGKILPRKGSSDAPYQLKNLRIIHWDPRPANLITHIENDRTAQPIIKVSLRVTPKNSPNDLIDGLILEANHQIGKFSYIFPFISPNSIILEKPDEPYYLNKDTRIPPTRNRYGLESNAYLIRHSIGRRESYITFSGTFINVESNSQTINDTYEVENFIIHQWRV